MEKLLSLINIGQNLYAKWLLQQLLSRIAVLACFAIVASTMVGGLVICGFIAIYMVFIHLGVPPEMAMLEVGGSALLATVILIVALLTYARRLKDMPRKLLMKKVPPVSQANDILDAFLDGLMGKSGSGTETK